MKSALLCNPCRDLFWWVTSIQSEYGNRTDQQASKLGKALVGEFLAKICERFNNLSLAVLFLSFFFFFFSCTIGLHLRRACRLLVGHYEANVELRYQICHEDYESQGWLLRV